MPPYRLFPCEQQIKSSLARCQVRLKLDLCVWAAARSCFASARQLWLASRVPFHLFSCWEWGRLRLLDLPTLFPYKEDLMEPVPIMSGGYGFDFPFTAHTPK